MAERTNNNLMTRTFFVTVVFLLTNISLCATASVIDKPCGGELVSMPWLKPRAEARLENRVTLHGDEITLVPVTKADGPFLEELGNIPDVRSNFGDRRDPDVSPISAETVKQLEWEATSTRGHYHAAWIIKKNGQSCGFIDVSRFFGIGEPVVAHSIINYRRAHGLRDVFDLVTSYIVHPRFRGQQLGSEALHLVKDFAENRLGADLILASIYSDNFSSQRVVTNNGFFPVHTEQATRMEWYSSKDLSR